MRGVLYLGHCQDQISAQSTLHHLNQWNVSVCLSGCLSTILKHKHTLPTDYLISPVQMLRKRLKIPLIFCGVVDDERQRWKEEKKVLLTFQQVSAAASQLVRSCQIAMPAAAAVPAVCHLCFRAPHHHHTFWPTLFSERLVKFFLFLLYKQVSERGTSLATSAVSATNCGDCNFLRFAHYQQQQQQQQ